MPFFKKSSSSKFPHLQLNQPDPVQATYQHHHRLDQSDNTTTTTTTTTHYFHPAHQPESPRKSTDINTTRNTNTGWSTSPTSIPTDPNKDIRGNPGNKDRDREKDPRQLSSTSTSTTAKGPLDFPDGSSSIRRHRLSRRFEDLARKPVTAGQGQGRTGQGTIQRSNTDSSLEKTASSSTSTSTSQTVGVRQVHTFSERIPQTIPTPIGPGAGGRPPSNTNLPLPSPLSPHSLRTENTNTSTMADQLQPGMARGEGSGSVHSNVSGSVKENTAGSTAATGDGMSTTAKREDTGGGGTEEDGLRQKHDELQIKYSRVKRYYFEKEAQVQHLQNTVAHQRMAVSRTVLDDNEYTSRFHRLDGAIKDLAFSIRKSWTSIPGWLTGYTNEDAAAVGMKEMTAIGRAVVSRYLGEGVFSRFFHPGLEKGLSVSLKGIEMTLRQQHQHQQHPSETSDEDRENAHARISNWRRTTLDGLSPSLTSSSSAAENRTNLIDALVIDLVDILQTHLTDPPPAGLDAGVRMIIENSISILEKIPLESRDVSVYYFLPGAMRDERVMRVETGVPGLSKPSPSHPPEGHSQGECQGQAQDAEDEDTDSDADTGCAGGSGSGSPTKKKSVFGALIGKKAAAVSSKKEDVPADENSTPTAAAAAGGRIRFATFLCVDVRGKGNGNVLVKAPVYMLE